MTRSAIVAIGAISAALVLLVVAAVMVVFAFVGSVPAYQLDLFGTEWQIKSVDGRSTGDPAPTLLFDDGGNAATLALPCGEVWLGWAMDTDGDAQSFGVNRVPPGCRTSPDDQRVIDAVISVYSWDVRDDEAISLVGGNQLELVRQPVKP
ncbi:MAG: hypothetical protein WEC14_08905 [Chloroflexota bacterium]